MHNHIQLLERVPRRELLDVLNSRRVDVQSLS